MASKVIYTCDICGEEVDRDRKNGNDKYMVLLLDKTIQKMSYYNGEEVDCCTQCLKEFVDTL